MRNGWRTATGGASKHEDVVKELPEVLNQPKKLAVIKVVPLKNDGTPQTRGNAEADGAEKQAARLKSRLQLCAHCDG